MPLCVEDFLDIIDHCGRSYSHSVLSSFPANEKPLPYTYTSPSPKDRHHKTKKSVHYSTADCGKDHVEDHQTTDVVNDILNNREDNRKMTSVLYSTFITTTLVYVISILIGIIDIEDSTLGTHFYNCIFVKMCC